MSFSLEELQTSVEHKLLFLEDYGDEKQITITIQKSGAVIVRDKADDRLIVGFTADEWKFLIDSRRVPGGNQDRD